MNKKITFNKKLSKKEIGKLRFGDLIEVSVGGEVFLSEIDKNGIQRFCGIEPYASDYDNGKIDLNQKAIDFYEDKITFDEYLKLNIGIRYSLRGFSELHNFHHLKIINPLWEDSFDEVYLIANYQNNNFSREYVLKELKDHYGFSDSEAIDYLERY